MLLQNGPSIPPSEIFTPSVSPFVRLSIPQEFCSLSIYIRPKQNALIGKNHIKRSLVLQKCFFLFSEPLDESSLELFERPIQISLQRHGCVNHCIQFALSLSHLLSRSNKIAKSLWSKIVKIICTITID